MKAVIVDSMQQALARVSILIIMLVAIAVLWVLYWIIKFFNEINDEEYRLKWFP